MSNWAAGLPSFQILLLALFPVILCAGRGVLRLVAVLDLLPEWREKLLAYGWAWTLLAPLVPFVYLYNTFVAAFTPDHHLAGHSLRAHFAAADAHPHPLNCASRFRTCRNGAANTGNSALGR